MEMDFHKLSSSDIKDLFQTVESLATSLGIFIGAVWVYYKFIRTRENQPKIEFEVAVRFLGRQGGKLLIEAVASLNNKGVVRHVITNFTCNILILRTDSAIVNGDKRINYQTLFEKCNPDKPEEKEKRIVWIPKNWYESFVDAGVKQDYTYVCHLPEDTTFVSIYSQFYYRNQDFQTAQKTFSIAALAKTLEE